MKKGRYRGGLQGVLTLDLTRLAAAELRVLRCTPKQLESGEIMDTIRKAMGA